MSKDFTEALLLKLVKDLHDKWKAEGVPDDDIDFRITDTKLERNTKGNNVEIKELFLCLSKQKIIQ